MRPSELAPGSWPRGQALRLIAAVCLVLPALLARWLIGEVEPLAIGPVRLPAALLAVLLVASGTVAAAWAWVQDEVVRERRDAEPVGSRAVRWLLHAGMTILIVLGWLTAGLTVLLGFLFDAV
ncbi:hypothetical protein [Cellulosimicrobium cellulans]|uniref:hypothetical protein n=1 Tax=Cellulosimicrobium cellulans TaxID=1710 RepID=UPI00130DB427|nr:hypothetical protein [Cellulosimicrobium cellulans]